MSVIRVEKNSNYTAMSNYHLRDANLSLKAKGLLSVCLSLPETWDYSVNGLASICKESRGAILTTLQELEQCGYVRRNQTRTADGRMGKSEYVILEIPRDAPPPQFKKPQSENPTTVKPTAEIPTSEEPSPENRGQLSKEQPNTDLIKKRQKESVPTRHEYGSYHNVLLSDEDMAKLQQEFPIDYRERIERLSEYIASSGKRYKNHLATLRSWARADKTKPPVRQYSVQNYTFSESESL